MYVSVVGVTTLLLLLGVAVASLAKPPPAVDGVVADIEIARDQQESSSSSSAAGAAITGRENGAKGAPAFPLLFFNQQFFKDVKFEGSRLAPSLSFSALDSFFFLSAGC